MITKTLDIIKLYLFPALHGKVIIALLSLAGAVLAFGFGGDLTFHITGAIGATLFSIGYENKASIGLATVVALLLVSVAVWLFVRIQFPKIPRFDQIARLEDAYKERGNKDSVCNLFREIHNVYVSKNELDDLMKNSETSVRARQLRNARLHVKFVDGLGFQLKSLKYPFRFLSMAFATIYFTTAIFCISIFTLIVASVAAGAPEIAAKLCVGLVALAVLSWSSLSAYATCRSSLAITSNN